EVAEQPDQALAMELVELGPRAAPATDLLHRGLVEPAPGVGELGPVHRELARLAERLAFPGDARSPVHHGTEDVEGERADRGFIHGVGLPSGMLRRAGRGRQAAAPGP